MANDVSYSVEECDGLFWVIEWGIYPPTSVLAGSTRKRRLEAFDTLDEAIEKYPGAGRTHRAVVRALEQEDLKAVSGLPDTPPAWFDPMDAGEEW